MVWIYGGCHSCLSSKCVAPILTIFIALNHWFDLVITNIKTRGSSCNRATNICRKNSMMAAMVGSRLLLFENNGRHNFRLSKHKMKSSHRQSILLTYEIGGMSVIVNTSWLSSQEFRCVQKNTYFSGRFYNARTIVLDWHHGCTWHTEVGTKS